MLRVFDTVADESAAVVRSYHLGLVGIYNAALTGAAPTAPRARVHAAEQVQQAQISMLSTLTPKLQGSSEAVLADALAASNPKLSDESRTQLAGMITDARNDMLSVLVTAILKDAETVNKRLRDFALKVDMNMNAAQTSYAQALYNVRAQEDDLGFSQVDRGNKRWSTTNYVRTSVRGFMVKTYVESYLYGLAHAGADIAKVVYPEEPEHLGNGTVFSITGSHVSLPAYSSIKAEIWHPNSRALVSQA